MDSSRRDFFAKLRNYAAVAGVSAVAASQVAAGHATTGAEHMQDELKRLRDAYTKLDKRMQLLIRFGVLYAGIGLLLDAGLLAGLLGAAAAEGAAEVAAAAAETSNSA